MSVAVSAADASRLRAAGSAPDSAPLSWPQDVSHTPSMKIGEVVDRLRGEFPALSISKVRYLESEGLIRPHRVGNGYRQYSLADVERLRFTLTAQRDEYLPLSVIRERLTELDAQEASRARGVTRIVACDGRRVDDGPIDLDELMARTGACESDIEQLLAAGIVVTDAHGLFHSAAQRAAELAMRVHACGVPLRNLRTVRSAAQRQADLIDQVLTPLRGHSTSGGEQEAAALTQAIVDLHSHMLRGAVDYLNSSL